MFSFVLVSTKNERLHAKKKLLSFIIILLLLLLLCKREETETETAKQDNIEGLEKSERENNN
jgi:hypothetical protein